MGETQRFLLLSILIGIFAGVVVVCFHIAIEYVNWRSIDTLEESPWWSNVLWPALGAWLAWAIVRWIFPAAAGSGVNATKAAIFVSDGYVPLTSVAGKFLASSVSIGSGNPMGPEDPALQMGAGIASALGRWFRLTRDQLRMIAPVGAAAGIGAAFNTPISAVLFVMEEVVAGWSAGVLGSIVLSAVSAVVVSRWFLGDDPLFGVPEFIITHPSELIVHAAIGVAAGLLSAGFVKLTLRLRASALAQTDRTKAVLPLLAGLLVGGVGVWFPDALGAGYRTIDGALHGRFPWELLLMLAALKMVTASTCFSVGVPGGMFAPALFIGATVGGGLGALAEQFWPFPTSAAGAYVLVGMGTFFAGLFRSPMTSIFMIFEVSASYVIILPAMIANTIAFLIARQMHPVPLLHTVAQQEGLHLPSVDDEHEFPALAVEDAMQEARERVFAPTLTLSAARDRMVRAGMDCGLVREGSTWYYLTRAELEEFLEAQPAVAMSEATDVGLDEQIVLRASGSATVGSLLPGHLALRVYPDSSLDAALQLLARSPILVVTSRANPHLLVGTLTLDDVHRAYGLLAASANPTLVTQAKPSRDASPG